MFTSADEPPPYSPTHTILPHYFELEPIPVRTYIIKDSTGFPFLYDFWLISTTTQASSSRPQSVLLQERGLSPQHQAELKYSIIRPQHTDRTALPITGPGATNAYFVPALALVADNYPSRWIWWGTEALQMVVFGRQLKNIILEWRWKHGRTRFGGPIVHRLVGCSFQISPDRRYCWKAGSGKLRSTTAQQARNRLRQQQQRTRASGVGLNNFLNASTSNNVGTSAAPSAQQTGRAAEGTGGTGWFGGLFGRARRPSRPNTELAELATAEITLDSVHVHTPPPEPPRESTIQDNPPLSAQESAIDSAIDTNAEDGDDDDDEAGCYHCREESSTAFLGRIVAVYKPGRPANRARDRAASSRKLEIFTEVGERCETAMMLMCTRLDDLFMSIPATKRGSLVTSRIEVSNRSSSGDGTAGGQQQQQQQQTATASTDGNLHGETGQGTGEDSLGVGGQRSNNSDQGGQPSLSPLSSVSFTKRLIGTRRDWLFRLKWIIAAILIAVVLVLVLKPKHSPPST
ncbi:hypothetical protein EC991_007461 [Linnemannia zychae]|nr:hypothetical protein EC991_007461 [Linnemannia zychae]